ncbi:MAG: hypothetical protein SFY66_09720 [Oculatellaceae cyanobacterium bins.114]|nr:hypothetical protein [Oculatellaceae cyanobacterium bins.114]
MSNDPSANEFAMMPFSDQTPKSSISGTRSGDDRPLSYQKTYICPICRHGQIAELTLMDAFACDFCRHIFTANLTEQSVQVVDSSQPMSWRWNGRNWRVAYQDDFNVTVLIWLFGVVLVVVPGAIVGLSAYTFPPLPDSPWDWFPMTWVACTFLVHLVMVVWVMVEHYQVPWYIAGKIRVRSLLGYR